jgi:photosystem II stability/assembly factor-like uncharacterized protein
MKVPILFAILSLATPAMGQQRPAQAVTPVNFDPRLATDLRFRYIGPVGNRTDAVAGVVGDANVYYAGAASGGIWKTTDAGIHWQPIFDNQPVSSIGALAVSRSNPNIVWAGTGEAFIRSHISLGNGVYKSTDAGRTWRRMGLEESGRIARIVIDPANPDIVFLAAMGHSYGPQQQRGVFRTRDGGVTWERVLFVDENTGGIDVQMDPTNSQVLFAATWQLLLHTWGRESGGPGSGIHVSRDGGTTWTKLQGNGLPTHTIGKIGLGIAPSNPNRVYALIETGDGVPYKGQPTDNGELWRSEDGGNRWQVVSYDRNLACRQPYYTRMAVSPDNPDETYFMCATFSRSMDGGATNRGAGFGGGGGGGEGEAGGARSEPPFGSPGGDNHDMWIDPTNPARMAVANDAGVSISTTRSRTWLRVNLPIAQIYHATVDNRVPYYVYGNKQDGPSYRGPSNSRTGGGGGGGGGGGIQRSEWAGVLGGESGFATPDPVDTNITWSTASGSGSRGGIVIRFDQRNRQGQNVEVWPLSTGGYAAGDVQYRFIWNAPFIISPNNHNRVYIGSQFVHTSTDGGKSWKVISQDLTRNDKTKQQSSGGLTPDNIGVEYGGTLMAIAESPIQKGVLWTGSNDGKVYVTRDSGGKWTDVSPPLTGAAAWGSAQWVEPSRYNAGTAYVTVDGHQEGNFDSWIFRTKDFGKTWDLIVTGIPKGILSYAHVIREDPVRRGLLYAGTENALYVSFDDGDHWQQMNNNLPPAPVYGLVIQEKFNDLVVATYGRGFWILDNLTAFQKLTTEVMAANGHLFPMVPAYRWISIPGNYASNDDPTVGQNPTYGASINYWAKAAGVATVEIMDSTNKVVRTLKDTARAGLNRTFWNLQNEPTKAAVMRTKPMFDEEFELSAEGTRPAAGFGNGFGVLMPPGKYSVKLTIAGESYTQLLEVRKDPSSRATIVEIAAKTRALLALQRDHAAASEMLNTIENVRAQIQAMKKQLANDASAADIRATGDALEQKFMDVEGRLTDLRLTGRGQDGVRWPTKLGGQLDYLAGTLDSDFGPTAQQREVGAVLAKQTRDTHTLLTALLNKELVDHNNMLRAKGLKTIEVTLTVP